ncbi:Zn-binding protein [Aliidiomarina iranensis]|uniref:UPF0225 protein CWE08_03500 n=1 Tax=Aliidiomarina iranensis TaxID=1434071 RepID=A0A432VZU9_9GAMM|nr:YchJ family metal-binding protein [Aliidiomarina iranensis]RUO22265.1 Zn-binding protein [Aliidiomarina iranensis]
MVNDALCPCGSEKSYGTCCGAFHSGAIPRTPEALMRSRYSAFVLGDTDYLLATWHESTRPKLDLSDNPNWVQLQVVSTWQRGARGFVHFKAFYKQGDELNMLEEKSKFIWERGRWFYVQAEQ